jgi:hypothetical protein
MTTKTYLRLAAADYEAYRARLDREMGFPDGRAETAIAPLDRAMLDADGTVLVAVRAPAKARDAAAIDREAKTAPVAITRETYAARVQTLDRSVQTLEPIPAPEPERTR